MNVERLAVGPGAGGRSGLDTWPVRQRVEAPLVLLLVDLAPSEPLGEQLLGSRPGSIVRVPTVRYRIKTTAPTMITAQNSTYVGLLKESASTAAAYRRAAYGRRTCSSWSSLL